MLLASFIFDSQHGVGRIITLYFRKKHKSSFYHRDLDIMIYQA